MTTLHERHAPTTTTTAGRGLLAAAGIALVISGAWGVVDELDSRLQRDIADTAYFRAFSLTHVVAFSLLAAAVAVVARRRWAGEGTGGRGVVALAVAGALQAVCAQWYVAFVTPTLSEVAPERVNAEEGFLAVGLGAALLSYAVALLALGVAALRSGRTSRRTAWLLVVAGALAVVLPGSQLVTGLALLSGRADGEPDAA
jgi:hypothetical protein